MYAVGDWAASGRHDYYSLTAEQLNDDRSVEPSNALPTMGARKAPPPWRR